MMLHAQDNIRKDYEHNHFETKFSQKSFKNPEHVKKFNGHEQTGSDDICWRS